MTSPRNSSPTRALVLGGGGAVGVGWQAGLLTGLREAGVDLAGADAVVGTSAGALVGALLSSGRDVTGALTSLAALGQSIDHDALAAGDEAFLSAMRQASLDTDPRQALRAIGRAAQQASMLAEDAYLGLFGTLEGAAWPAGFRCTATDTDTDTGDLAVWDQGPGGRPPRGRRARTGRNRRTAAASTPAGPLAGSRVRAAAPAAPMRPRRHRRPRPAAATCVAALDQRPGRQRRTDRRRAPRQRRRPGRPGPVRA